MENKKIKILAIDDIKDNLSTIKALIVGNFPEAIVLTAQSGRLGIELAISTNPDVILLDIVMPNMDGYEVCRRLKENDNLRDIPVVFITAVKGDKDNRILALEVGAEAFLSKPIDESELIAQIRAMVKVRKSNVKKRDETEKLQILVEEKVYDLKQELSIRIETEKLLMVERKTAQMYLDIVGVMILGLDKKGNIILINDKGCEILEAKQDEIIGKNWFDNFLPSESLDEIKSLFNDVFLEDKVFLDKYENTVITAKKERRSIYWNNTILFDENKNKIGVLCSGEDVSERNKIADSLRKSEKRYREVVDNLDAGVIVHASDSSIIKCNKKALTLLGITESQIMGKKDVDQKWNFVNFDHSEMSVENFPVNLILSNKKPIKNKLLGIFKPNNSVITWVNVNGIPILNKDGEILEIVISFIDVTEIKQKELELEYSASNDFLTGIKNRRYFEENLVLYDKPENYPLTIIMADINGLKLINDAFGHSAGDSLLISAVNIIVKVCNEEDLIARIGGDEFVIAMKKTDEKEAEIIISKINEESKHINIESIALSISFGYKTKHHESEKIEEILRSAEDLMYREKLLEIPSMRSSAILTILNTLYEKDEESEVHSRAVSNISEKFAVACKMNRQDVAEVKTAGLLHDIGKIIIPLSIITKEGKLSIDEYSTMKTHSEIGFRILNSTHDMRSISHIVLNHHERWDGTGYPRGIKSNNIPIKSRIISIADAFDAMTSKRTYRELMTNEEALTEIITHSGTQFDPEMVLIFEKHFSEIIKTKE